MLPPRIVYSLVIRNRSNQTAVVKVSYTDANDTVSNVEISVPANGSATAPQQTYQQGTAVFAKEITRVGIVYRRRQGSPSSISAPFPTVHSPTSEYPIEIVTTSGGLAVQSGYSN